MSLIHSKIPLIVASTVLLGSMPVHAATYQLINGTTKGIYYTFNFGGGVHPYSGIDLGPGVVSQNADLSGAQLASANLTSANLSGADFTNASFFLSNLSGANFSSADFQNVSLYNASLTGANLTGANLADTDLTGADLSDTILNNVRSKLWSSKSLLGSQK